MEPREPDLGADEPPRSASADAELANLANLATCLSQLSVSDGKAAIALEGVAYSELRAIAAALLANVRPGHTLQPTALVHEAWIKVARLDPAAERGRRQFLALAAKAMRSILIDHARGKAAVRRGAGKRRETLGTVTSAGDADPSDLLDVDAALLEFEAIDPARAKIIELMFYGGLTAAEAAEVLGITPRSVERGWSAARAWLHRRLRERAPLQE